jgi:hypothetical protein
LDYIGHSGFSDSKFPGFEAVAQKLMSTMYNVSVFGNGNFVADKKLSFYRQKIKSDHEYTEKSIFVPKPPLVNDIWKKFIP